MKKNSLLSKLKRLISRRNLTLAGVGTAVIVIGFAAATLYYYITTPAASIIVTTAEFPSGLSTSFTADSLTTQIVSRLEALIRQADADDGANESLLQGLGPRPARQTTIPIRALSNSPSPLFKYKWHGVDLNFFQQIGISLKAKDYLELSVVGLPNNGGWRLLAFLKSSPQFAPSSAGSAPQTGGACSDLENCASDLSEQILNSLDSRRLLSAYIKKKTPAAAKRIVELYKAIPANTLDANDLVAWGNAFSTLGQNDEALQKYEEALEKNSKSCSAQVARGFVYYTRARGDELMKDLKQAEQDFRAGVACDQKNEYTRTSLCHTLLKQWLNTKNPQPQTLEEARQQCQQALDINPRFAQASVNLAYVLYRQEKYGESLDLFAKLGQRYPGNSVLFLNYGFVEYLTYLRTHDQNSLKQATEHTLKAWNLDSTSDIAATNLGFFYYEQNELTHSLEFFKKANELLHNDTETLAGLALVTEKLGNRDAALNYLSQAIQVDSNYRNPEYLMKNNNWSTLAAQDLARLVPLIPT